MLLKKKNTIPNFTYVSDKLSDKSIRILSKDIQKLELTELSHLIRESLAVQVCINIALERLGKIIFDYEFSFNNKVSEAQREILRELILLNNFHWDVNPKVLERLKGKLAENYWMVKLPDFIIDKFKYYQPKKLIWNENSTKKFNAYMNDTRVGVLVGYNMVIPLKRAILNGNSVDFIFKGEKRVIDTIDEFEEFIVKNIICYDELRSLLDREKQIKFSSN